MLQRTAKAIEQGKGSILVTLPRDWARGRGIVKGDLLALSYDADVVHVRPAKKGTIVPLAPP